MALKVLQPGHFPIGQYDGVDAEIPTFMGGEVVTFSSISLTSGDLASYDSLDGYTNPNKRPVVTRTLTSGKRPLMLADEGITGYGTLFGSVVGGTVGQVSVGGALLGPNTATGSGKITCWHQPGLYAVSLDASCDSSTSTGLRPTNTTLDTGAPLYATATGLLTPNPSVAFEAVVVARFVSFETNGSLVTTPNKLVHALNSPSGSPAPIPSYSIAVFHFYPEL